ncbi:hypothetical protein OHA21_00675 [Actinoplanes sp. NBC_00393]|uniref:hypothetical protein n=1 Tax=Actinoplanes sp. NBC_00393 TaxID=2975953 RepID=UPI002E1EB22E
MKSRLVNRTTVAAAASLAVAVPLAACSGPDTSPPASPPSTPAGSSPPGISTESGGAGYEDGTYTARGVYGGAPSYMTITLGLRAGTITDVTVEPMPENNDTSRGYQERFAAAVPDEVIGKSIDEVRVGKLAGASGCADGFNNAVAAIRDQARAGN